MMEYRREKFTVVEYIARNKNLSKFLISSVICVGVLYLLDLLAMFGLHRIELVQLIILKRLYKQIKAA